MSINRVNISGNLTRDPELRQTQGGMAILSMGVAVNDRRRNQATGEWEEYPNFVDCVVFGNRCEFLHRNLRKGKKVHIEGKLRYSSWEKDGQKRSKLEVVVDDIDFELPPKQQTQQGYAPQQPPQVYPQQGYQQPAPQAYQPQYQQPQAYQQPQGYAQPASAPQAPPQATYQPQQQYAPQQPPQPQAAPPQQPQQMQMPQPVTQQPAVDVYDEDIPF